MKRLGLVIHPTRQIDAALDQIERWADEHEVEVVQLDAGIHDRELAPIGEIQACDLAVAVGGDGTVLAALRTAGETDAPVLGVACGSLGALTTTPADEVGAALDSFAAGDWQRWPIPALDVAVDGEVIAFALNDFVTVRQSGQQLTADISIGGEVFGRIAGDGVVAATLLGSSAYSLAAGGPLLISGVNAYTVTPLLSHGGSVPPAVVPADLETEVRVHKGFGGFDVEIDGQERDLGGSTFTLSLVESKASLVGIGQARLAFTGLRKRGLIADSPRVLARDERERAAERGKSETA